MILDSHCRAQKALEGFGSPLKDPECPGKLRRTLAIPEKALQCSGMQWKNLERTLKALEGPWGPWETLWRWCMTLGRPLKAFEAPERVLEGIRRPSKAREGLEDPRCRISSEAETLCDQQGTYWPFRCLDTFWALWLSAEFHVLPHSCNKQFLHGI